MRYSNVGSYRWTQLDLVVSVMDIYESTNPFVRGSLGESLGQIWVRGDVKFNFEIQDHVTNDPVVLPALQFSVIDSYKDLKEGAHSVNERHGVTGYKYARYYKGDDPEASFSENTKSLYDWCDAAIDEGKNCLVTQFGGLCGTCTETVVFGGSRILPDP